ncbi:MAG TPA: TolC family protein [Bryobacteraceae bacterium]|nr:TolC family protein [Bryobacteraceae bacterium]
MRRHRICLALLTVPAILNAQDTRTLELSLKRAVEIAISPEGSARVQLAGEAVKQAQSRSAQARAALLPDIESSVSDQNMTRNLAALGVQFEVPIPGFQFPTMVGPFTVFDARATATQNVFDFSSIRRYQASRAGVRAARSEGNAAEDKVAAQVAKAYVAALRSEADVEAAEANVQLAQALLKQAEDVKAAGTGTGIEVTRARVELSNEKQRLLVAQNARRKAHLELARSMGIALDTDLVLTDKLAYVPVDHKTLAQATTEALKARSDLRAQRQREDNARLSSSATRMERLPSLEGFADYGSIGSSINRASPTRTYGLSLRVPIFDGGRRDARRAEAASQFRQESIRTRDLQDQVQLEVRLALDALGSADEQVQVARDGLTLAQDELAQARRRYDAGVANGLEVTDAQTRLARARDNEIEALFNYNQARIDLGQATGTIRSMIQ